MAINKYAYEKQKYVYINKIITILYLIMIFAVFLNNSSAIPFSRVHENISIDILEDKCSSCHQENLENPEKHREYVNAPDPDNKSDMGKNILSAAGSGFNLEKEQEVNNYSILLRVGQTPYQIGPFLRWDGWIGYSWWDTADYMGEFSFGTEIQKNLISMMVLENRSGSIKAIQGLVSPPTYPQVTRRSYSQNYSYKADTDDPRITYKYDQTGSVAVYAENNYENNVDLWMVKELDLSGYNSVSLSFKAWYEIEKDFDYGYVMVSTDSGNTWTNLNGSYTSSADPNGHNLGNGITGTSSEWLEEKMDLTLFSGKKIVLAFRFVSDAATNMEGWYIDDINITSNSTSIFKDNAETPIKIKTLSINVSYPHLSIMNITDPLSNSSILGYTVRTQKVDLFEDLRHPGIYTGYFLYKVNNEFYSGNYSVVFNGMINNTPVKASTKFQTTILGCNNCHNKRTYEDGTDSETSFIHAEYGGGEFCAFACHSGSRGFYLPPVGTRYLRANPMHLHEMKFGHAGGFPAYYPAPATSYNAPAHVTEAECIQCHTNFLHDTINNDTYSIGNYVLHGTNISYSSRAHENLSCVSCHGTLEYPEMPQDKFLIKNSLGTKNHDFTSYETFTDTYIITINDTMNLNITVTGDNTNKKVSLYTVGPVDNTSSGLMGPCPGGGPCEIIQGLVSPINLNISAPYMGIWIAKIIQKQEGIVNYTISSNYPIAEKPIIRIPECNSCHNPNGSGKTLTKYEIQDWNSGFSHADINNDGTHDIQCRMCHDSMHEITIKGCIDCHLSAPSDHPVGEPSFSQYDIGRCLNCHGDPHNVTSAGGTDCAGCHFPHDVNITKYDLHANVNRSDGNGNVSNADCWTCHYQKDMDKNHIYYCENCHVEYDS